MVRAMTYPPTHGDLVDKALTYLRENQRKEWRAKTPEQRTEYAELAVKRAERYANTLQKMGMFESDAWNTAIRQEILGSESD
jgi:acyl-CoA reductase-like NAD-dependent aldehyde dehydrogenase